MSSFFVRRSSSIQSRNKRSSNGVDYYLCTSKIQKMRVCEKGNHSICIILSSFV